MSRCEYEWGSDCVLFVHSGGGGTTMSGESPKESVSVGTEYDCSPLYHSPTPDPAWQWSVSHREWRLVAFRIIYIEKGLFKI